MLLSSTVMSSGSRHESPKDHGNGESKSAAKLRFIDFGCGAGASFSFAASLASSNADDEGLGIDYAADAVDTCLAKGISAELADVTKYDRRNVADATFAIGLLPELPGRAAFEAALVNIIRAARNYTLIQHAYFDADGPLATLGVGLNGNDSKKIQYKPTVADYVNFLRRNGDPLNIVGLAVFGIGKGEPTSLGLVGVEYEREHARDMKVYRSVRVIFARREIKRFRAALEKAAAGQALFMWEREAA